MRLPALSLALGCALWATSPLWSVPSHTKLAAPGAPISLDPTPHPLTAPERESSVAGRAPREASRLPDFPFMAGTSTRRPEGQLELASRSESPPDRLAREREAVLRSRRAWPYFDRLESPRSAVSLGVKGVDPAAPRRLVLWRLGETPRRVATAWSDRGGTFDFGQQLVPATGVRYLVAPDVAGEYQRLRPGRLANAPAASRVSLRRVAGD